MSKKLTELEKNIEAYESLRAELVENNLGKVALFADGKLFDVYNDLADAYKIGVKTFGEGSFSLKEIGAKASNLGIMRYFLKPCGLMESSA